MMVSTYLRDNDDDVIELKTTKGAPIVELSIKYRPFLYEFLDDVSQKYELILYSTFNSQYVRAIADVIERKKKYFVHVFHDEFCLFANISSGMKCIDFLMGKRSAKDIIVVDTIAVTCPLTPENYVPIERFMGDDVADNELIKLARVLDELAEVKDIRQTIKEWRGMGKKSVVKGETQAK